VRGNTHLIVHAGYLTPDRANSGQFTIALTKLKKKELWLYGPNGLLGEESKRVVGGVPASTAAACARS
jgi:hypothetical protein